MADPELLDSLRKPKRPAPPGGGTRPSLRASLRALPLVRRRQELNRMLLANSCGNGAPAPVKFKATDLGLLIQIAEERGSNTNPLLRRQAVASLAQFRELDAATALARLAHSDLEHPSVRISALTSLQTLSPQLAVRLDLPVRKAKSSSARKVKKARRGPPKDKR